MKKLSLVSLCILLLACLCGFTSSSSKDLKTKYCGEDGKRHAVGTIDMQTKSENGKSELDIHYDFETAYDGEWGYTVFDVSVDVPSIKIITANMKRTIKIWEHGEDTYVDLGDGKWVANYPTNTSMSAKEAAELLDKLGPANDVLHGKGKSIGKLEKGKNQWKITLTVGKDIMPEQIKDTYGDSSAQYEYWIDPNTMEVVKLKTMAEVDRIGETEYNNMRVDIVMEPRAFTKDLTPPKAVLDLDKITKAGKK